MSRPRLIHNTKTEVLLCEWHLRCIFWDERIWEKYYTYELDIELEPLRERPKRTVVLDGKYNQEILFTDPNKHGEQVARCHWFIAEDGVTPVASGCPDPKELNWRGINFRKFKDGGICEYCLADIPSKPTGDAWD